MKKNDFQELVDRNLSGLRWNERQRQRVLAAINEEEKPVKKVSATFILAAAIICISLTALAAGILLNPKVDAIREATAALEKQYGITTEMQTYFQRKIEEKGNGKYTITYTGREDLDYVLGTYTVMVDGKTAAASWSHDGEKTAGGFDAEAWGSDQLNEMMEISRRQHGGYGPYYEKAKAAAEKHRPALKDEANQEIYTEEQIQQEEEEWNRKQQELQKKSKLSVEKMVDIAREVAQSTYKLSAEQADALMHNPHLSWFYVREDGVPCYDAILYLQQKESDGPAEFAEYTTMDGTYTVVINTDTGEVVDVMYEADLIANG